MTYIRYDVDALRDRGSIMRVRLNKLFRDGVYESKESVSNQIVLVSGVPTSLGRDDKCLVRLDMCQNGPRTRRLSNFVSGDNSDEVADIALGDYILLGVHDNSADTVNSIPTMKELNTSYNLHEVNNVLYVSGDFDGRNTINLNGDKSRTLHTFRDGLRDLLSQDISSGDPKINAIISSGREYLFQIRNQLDRVYIPVMMDRKI